MDQFVMIRIDDAVFNTLFKSARIRIGRRINDIRVFAGA